MTPASSPEQIEIDATRTSIADITAYLQEHLDIAEVRSRQRIVTQALSPWLFDQGTAGIVYRSNLDDLPCVALFEGRATAIPDGEPELLTETPAELLDVCSEYGLTLGSRA